MPGYPATYTDAHGSEACVIHDDGSTLRVTIRGVTVEGSSYDMREPVESTPPEETSTVQETHLCPAFERRVPGTGYRG